MAMGRWFGGSAGVSKYKAIRTTVDGIIFDSKAESEYYLELKLLERAGELKDLELQPRFPLFLTDSRTGESVKIGEYRADFRYKLRSPVNARANAWPTIIDDVKGVEVPLQKWKRRHAELQYGITVRIVRRRAR
jgi:hypothetical protein